MDQFSTRKQKLVKRLSGYWKMEAVNIVLLPIIILFLTGGEVGPLAVLAAIPMMGLLAIGATYWRAKHAQLAHGRIIDPTVRLLARWRIPALVATITAAVMVGAAFFVPSLATGTPDLWAAAFASLLAVLEYMNYYWRQLQHFDHLADFKRLVSGDGFRKSQLRQDLERLGLR